MSDDATEALPPRARCLRILVVEDHANSTANGHADSRAHPCTSHTTPTPAREHSPSPPAQEISTAVPPQAATLAWEQTPTRTSEQHARQPDAQSATAPIPGPPDDSL